MIRRHQRAGGLDRKFEATGCPGHAGAPSTARLRPRQPPRALPQSESGRRRAGKAGSSRRSLPPRGLSRDRHPAREPRSLAGGAVFRLTAKWKGSSFSLREGYRGRPSPRPPWCGVDSVRGGGPSLTEAVDSQRECAHSHTEASRHEREGLRAVTEGRRHVTEGPRDDSAGRCHGTKASRHRTEGPRYGTEGRRHGRAGGRSHREAGRHAWEAGSNAREGRRHGTEGGSNHTEACRHATEGPRHVREAGCQPA